MNSMNPSFLLRLATLSLLLAAGCTVAEMEGDGASDGDQATVEACLSLNVLPIEAHHTRSVSFTAPGVAPDEESETVGAAESNAPATKAVNPSTGVDEDVVSELWIGQYDASGRLLVNTFIPSFTGTEVNIKLQPIPGKSHIYLVTNAGDLTSVVSGHDEAYFKTLTTDKIPDNKKCIMFGSLEKEISTGFVAPIALTRAMAKVSFTYTVADGLFSFEPIAVTLYNMPQNLQYFPPTNQIWGYGFLHSRYDGPGITSYWYIPDNLAGTGINESGDYRNKLGASMATYLQLRGTFTQYGISYIVDYNIYLGDGPNDYNVRRNNNYTIAVQLAGIDFADKRVVIFDMPSMTNPKELSAIGNSTTEFRVVVQPGAPWSFIVPSWLTAKKGYDPIVAGGAKMEGTGPATVIFTTPVNPYDSPRTADFIVTVGRVTKSIKVTQSGPVVEGKKLYILDTNDDSYTERRGFDYEFPNAVSYKRNYQIEVSSVQNGNALTYSDAQKQCASEGYGWRCPNLYELHVMYKNRAALGQPAFISVAPYWYWTSTPFPNNRYCQVDLYISLFGYSPESFPAYVRCVRDI